MNIIAVLVSALVPMALGMVWYNNKTFGNAWMHASGMTPEKAKQGNMALIFGFSLLFSFMLALSLQFMVIHQLHITSAFFDYQNQIKDATTPEGSIYKQVMDLVGTGHRTFGHGALHGTISGLFVALPIVGINALFEQRSGKYILIHAGFWTVCMAIMGGILSVWM